MSRREQLLERVQVVAQRIVYRVRRAVISNAPDARTPPPGPEPGPRTPPDRDVP